MACAVGTKLKVRGLLWSVRACARIENEEGREAAAIFNAVVISSSVTLTPSRHSKFFNLPRARIRIVSGWNVKDDSQWKWTTLSNLSNKSGNFLKQIELSLDIKNKIDTTQKPT